MEESEEESDGCYLSLFIYLTSEGFSACILCLFVPVVFVIEHEIDYFGLNIFKRKKFYNLTLIVKDLLIISAHLMSR